MDFGEDFREDFFFFKLNRLQALRARPTWKVQVLYLYSCDLPDVRTGAQAEAVQVLPRCHVDLHHVPRQLNATGDALQMSKEQRGVPHQAARLPDARGRHRLPVQLRVFAADGEGPLYPLSHQLSIILQGGNSIGFFGRLNHCLNHRLTPT